MDWTWPTVTELQLLFNGRSFALRERQTLIGRSRRCAIVLGSRLASREHCVIERTGKGLTLIELGSKNGTWVNGERVARRQQLVNGDQIRIGTDQLEVRSSPEPAEVGGQQLSMQTQRMDWAPAEEPFGEDSTASVDHASVLDLAEVLLETASGIEQRPQTTQLIVAAIDELLDHAGLTQPYINAPDADRLRAIADRLHAWWTNGSLDAWRHGLERRLRAAGRS
jgi:pSer/pThr/pTyr-binding forkhead associated (FHA) protein